MTPTESRSSPAGRSTLRYSISEQLRDPTAHAETIAITQAAEARGSWRLDGCTLYVTLEPCPMCAGAVLQPEMSSILDVPEAVK